MDNKIDPKLWAGITIAVAVIGCVSALGVAAITALPTLVKTSSPTPFTPDVSNPTLESNILFQDQFETDSLASDWQVVNGNWRLNDGVLEGINAEPDSHPWAILTLDKELPNDFSVSYRTKIVDGSVTEIMIHLAENRYVRVYLYSISQGVYFGDGVLIGRNEPGSVGLPEILDSLGGGATLANQGFPVIEGTWYNVRVTTKGNTYFVSVGGQPIIQYVDNKHELSGYGTIGFISNGNMQFDDLTITK